MVHTRVLDKRAHTMWAKSHKLVEYTAASLFKKNENIIAITKSSISSKNSTEAMAKANGINV